MLSGESSLNMEVECCKHVTTNEFVQICTHISQAIHMQHCIWINGVQNGGGKGIPISIDSYTYMFPLVS